MAFPFLIIYRFFDCFSDEIFLGDICWQGIGYEDRQDLSQQRYSMRENLHK